MQFPNLSISSLPTFAQIRPFFSDLGSKISALKTSVFQNSAQTFASLDKKTIVAFSVGTCLGFALCVLFAKSPAADPNEDPNPDPLPNPEPLPNPGPLPTEDPVPAGEPIVEVVEPTTMHFITSTIASSFNKAKLSATDVMESCKVKISPLATQIIESSMAKIDNIKRDPIKASVLMGGTPAALLTFVYAVTAGESALVGLALIVAFLFVGTAMHYAYNNSALVLPVVA